MIKLTSLISNISLNNSPQLPPNSNTPTSQGSRPELANLAKIYTNKVKYSDENISFAFKLMTFHDICTRLDVSQETLLKAFPTMPTGLALDYYYSNSKISITATFDEICELINIYFERAEYMKSV